MPLKTPQQYIESLRDGRVTYWDGERIDDITTHPRFKVPIAITASDYDYQSAECGALRRYTTEDGSEAHRIYQIPRSAEDLASRIEMMKHTSIGTLVSAVYMVYQAPANASGGSIWNNSAQPRKTCTTQRGQSSRASDHAARVAMVRHRTVLAEPT